MVNKDPEVGWNDENVLRPQFRLADEIRLLVFSQHFYRLVVFMLQQVFCAKINKMHKNQWLVLFLLRLAPKHGKAGAQCFCIFTTKDLYFGQQLPK